jgi:hypothetical protein
LQTAKKLNKEVPTSTTVKMPSKAVLTHNFFTPLRTTMGMETTEVKNTLLEQEAPRKPGRLSSIVMTSNANLIQL